MEIEDLGESGGKNVKLAIAILLIIFAILLCVLLVEVMGRHSWLQLYCNINMAKEFEVESVASPGQAEELAASIIEVDRVQESKVQYCRGYAIVSGDRRYFLCQDGRLYELISCYKMEHDQRIPMLPELDDIW
jgi:hypothetical protein